MANKIIETLTIGGTSFDMHSAEHYGDTKNITLPTASTAVKCISHTIQGAGIYIFKGFVGFGAGSTTGETYRYLYFKSDNIITISAAFRDASSGAAGKEIVDCLKITDDNPREISLWCSCSKPVTTNMQVTLNIIKVVDIKAS